MTIKLVVASVFGDSIAYIHDELCTSETCLHCQEPLWDGTERRVTPRPLNTQVLRDDSIYVILNALNVANWSEKDQCAVWKRG